jgi:hypothetical protein
MKKSSKKKNVYEELSYPLACQKEKINVPWKS